MLDACALYPAPIRGLLLQLASFGLYTPKWTARIPDEWTRHLLKNRADLNAGQLQKTVAALRAAFPAAEVKQDEPLLAALDLPDPDDRHILAAAMRCQATIIVTANLKDFPAHQLAQFDIGAQHPAVITTNLIDLNPEPARVAFRKQVSFLKNPPRTVTQVLDNFRQVQLKASADKLAALL